MIHYFFFINNILKLKILFLIILIKGDSPFDLVLTNEGDDFAVMGMHFKLGSYNLILFQVI